MTGPEAPVEGAAAAAAPGGALRQPPALQPGDPVALFSPSSHPGREPPELTDAALATLAEWGLRPLPVAPAAPRHLYLAGTDAVRASEFERLYSDPAVKALFATRGGYGAARMLPRLDPRRVAAAPPKAVVGMSDVGALFGFLHAAAGLGAVHGPCLAAPSCQQSPARAQELEALRTLLFHPERGLEYPCSPLLAGRGGTAEGRLLGGTLAVLAAGVGTPWGPDCRGAIVFLEDVGEAPYRIDRYLTQLRQGAHLDDAAGVVFGHLPDCDGEPPGLLEAVLGDLFAEASCPVAVGLPAGHRAPNLALPLGRVARLRVPDDPGAAGALEIA